MTRPLARLIAWTILILILSATCSYAQQIIYPPLLFRDEGSDIGRATKAINCTGAGITCSVSAGVITINATGGGGGGGGNFVEISLGMTSGSGVYSVTVTGQAWVTGTSIITCTPFGTTADGLTAEQIATADLTVSTSDRVVGTGFNLNVFNPFGSHGTHRIHCTGG